MNVYEYLPKGSVWVNRVNRVWNVLNLWLRVWLICVYIIYICFEKSMRQWFSGKIQHSHCWAPGSIPGWRRQLSIMKLRMDMKRNERNVFFWFCQWFCIPCDEYFYLIVVTIEPTPTPSFYRFLFDISCGTESRLGIYHNCKPFLSTKNRGAGCWKNKWPNLHGTTVSGIPVLRMWPLFTLLCSTEE